MKLGINQAVGRDQPSYKTRLRRPYVIGAERRSTNSHYHYCFIKAVYTLADFPAIVLEVDGQQGEGFLP